ncbi:MAG: hypothetical protein U0797_07825 [Gemmataceae bacterium]|jgi:hypothetical protein
MNPALALTLTVTLAGCTAYDRPYYGPARPGYAPRIDHSARSSHLGGDEGARHAHMDAEREHLRQEEADETRRHTFGY